MVTPLKFIRNLLILCCVAVSSVPVPAHETPTHAAITQRALEYLRLTDPNRHALLIQNQGFSATLADGAVNEDAYFEGNGCMSAASVPGHVPCFLGRFYFHFLPTLDETLTVGSVRLRQGATCTSVNWGIDGINNCTAFSVSLGSPTGIEVVDVGGTNVARNDHQWSNAIAAVDASGSPTLEGWRHLGYLIHLLEDLTSPPHTRNSAHPCIAGFLFCDPLDSLQLDAQVNLPASDYVGLLNLQGPADLFKRVKDYTHLNYFSARTAFKDGGPVSVIDDDTYFYGACLQVSKDVGTCGPVGAMKEVRKIASKGPKAYVGELLSEPTQRGASIDKTIGKEQFRELGPVAVLGAATLIKIYAPMLSVSLRGNGHGGVKSTSGNLNCTNASPLCATLLAQKPSGPPSMVLTATPAPDSTFVGWSEDCASGGATATITLTRDKSCTVTFALKPALTVVIGGSASGSVVSTPAGIDCGTACSAAFAPGGQVTLTATPAPGAAFNGWSGACTGTAASFTLTMTGDKSCTASFIAAVPRFLSASSIGTGIALITSSPSGISCPSQCSAAFPGGTAVTLRADFASGFTGTTYWSGNCSGSGPTATVVLTANKHCDAQRYATPFPFGKYVGIVTGISNASYAEFRYTSTTRVIAGGQSADFLTFVLSSMTPVAFAPALVLRDTGIQLTLQGDGGGQLSGDLVNCNFATNVCGGAPVAHFSLALVELYPP